MRGGGVHLAPFGSLGMLMFHFSCSGSNLENAIDFPSGDQRTSRGVSSRCVICVAGPSASTQRTNTCEPLGSPSATYRSRFPSGAQRADEPLAKNRCSDPSLFRIQVSDSHLSSSLFTCSRV